MHRNLLHQNYRFLSVFFLALAAACCFAAPSEAASNEPTKTNATTISITAGDQTEILDESRTKDWFSFATTLSFDPWYRSEIEKLTLCPTDMSFCEFVLSSRGRESFRSATVQVPQTEPVREYISALGKKISKEPVDARFAVSEGKTSVFALSQDGRKLDEEASLSILLDTLRKPSDKNSGRSASLPIIALKPSVTSSDAADLGILELIGEGRTNFAGSPVNRIHNFKRALEQFNGVMISPGEEFSFVKFLGDVDGEHGYLPELVIKHNRTEPEFGGGICQVSSTVFRAAIYSGLKVTMRRNHAYPVSYYKPYGMDATIYVPKPDLRFVNNTPGHILMQSSIEGTQLIFRFYGTSDGRKTEVDGPHILEHNPDGSMKTVFTQKVLDTNGNTLISDDFRSNYASPSKFPHPGQEPVFTEKPDDWSKSQWSDYKKAHSL